MKDGDAMTERLATRQATEQQFHNIPDELRQLDQWVLWKLEPSANGKPTKVPYSANGTKAAVNRPGTWMTFADAMTLVDDYNGIGFVFSKHDPYFGFDVDAMTSAEDDRLKYVRQLDSYTERSQSGKGMHVIARGKKPGRSCKKTKLNVELYDRDRWFVMTGDTISGYPTGIEDRQSELEALYGELWPAKASKQVKSSPGRSEGIPADDDALWERIFASQHGDKWLRLYMGELGDYNDDHSSADYAMLTNLAFWTAKDAGRMERMFEQTGLVRPKWETRPNYRADTIAKAIAVTGEVYTPRNRGEQDDTQDQNDPRLDGSAPDAVDQNEPQPEKPKPQLSERIGRDLQAWGYTIRMSDLDDSIEINGQRMTDALNKRVRMTARDKGYASKGGPTLGALDDAIGSIAHDNRYHPIRDYLNGLQWDGKNHISALAGHFADAHETIVYSDGFTRTVFDACLRRWLFGAIAKVFVSDGAVRPQNPVLVLVGGQSLGKSTFAQWLCPIGQYFVSSPIRPDSKDDQIRLMTKWVWEIGEVGSTTRRQDREALKWFITLQDVTVRAPYGKFDVTKPALSSFIGTLNPEQGYLTDPTGNRRFVTVELDAIDHSYSTKIDVNQVWAQAMSAWRENPESWKFEPEELAVIGDINDGHKVAGAHAGMLERLFEIDPGRDDWFLPTGDIINRLHTHGGVSITASLEQLVGSTLQGMGCKRVRRGPKVDRKMGYTGISEKIAVGS